MNPSLSIFLSAPRLEEPLGQFLFIGSRPEAPVLVSLYHIFDNVTDIGKSLSAYIIKPLGK